MVEKFVILPDGLIKNNSLIINQRIHDKQIVVTPCHSEHWISTDLFKFRIYCDKNEMHVIGICSRNQIPMYSIFCDEIWLVRSKPRWYSGHTLNGIHVRGRFRKRTDYCDIEQGEFRRKFMLAISDEEVVDRFSDSVMYFLESGWKKFSSLREKLPTNVVMSEIKSASRVVREPHLESGKKCFRGLEKIPFVGIDQQFQISLVEKTGIDHYMTVQIMASNFLNWQFFCLGGSSNLMCILPVRLLFMNDHRCVNESVGNIVRGFMLRKHGIAKLPYVNMVDEMFPRRGEATVNEEMLKESFTLLSNDYSIPELILPSPPLLML